jgi:anti-sigma factor RsiW
VRDLSANGFPLLGGRLDYLDGKTVAALIYQRNKHPINLFITPEQTSRSTSPTMITRRGYNVFSWTNNGMKYWAVSDLNQAELSEFTELVRAMKSCALSPRVGIRFVSPPRQETLQLLRFAADTAASYSLML